MRLVCVSPPILLQGFNQNACMLLLLPVQKVARAEILLSRNLLVAVMKL
jgi:hypothetical protein